MNFEQIQLLDYAFYCAADYQKQNNDRNYFGKNIELSKLIIQSESDIFTANTFSFNESGNIEFKIPNFDYALKYEQKYIDLNPDNPFYLVRHFVYSEFIDSGMGRSAASIIQYPEVFLKAISEYIIELNIQYGFEMPKFFYNYQSLLHENLSLPFLAADQESYRVLSVNYQFDEPQS